MQPPADPLRSYAWSTWAHHVVSSGTLCYFGVKSHRPGVETHVRRAAKDLEHVGVTNYAVFRLFGGLDLLVRAWVPAFVSAAEVLQALSGEDPSAHAMVVKAETVFEPTVHSEESAVGRSKERALRMIEGLARESSAELDVAKLSAAATDILLSESLLVPEFNRELQVRFFVFVESAHLRIGRRTESFLSELAHFSSRHGGLLPIRSSWASGSANCVFEGLADRTGDVADFVEHLPDQLELHPDACQIATYIAARATPIMSRDVLARPSSARRSSLMTTKRLISRSESAHLEFRATAFTDVFRILRDGTLRESEAATETLAKIVVAMLNSDGGDVVVGVVGRDLVEGVSQLRLPLHAQQYGGLLLLGVEVDAAFIGIPTKDLTTYVRDALTRYIAPGPSTSFDIWVDEVQGVELLRIHVSPAEGWCYMKREPNQYEFVIRDGYRTVALRGPDADRFKASHPRESTVD